ncbi:MAG TPA: hypothetical protein VFT29_12465 [Gemmatimonadaceae bacterium]|nr:hypothetical protein [Gemmatimonadaceae bacterium]
MTESARRLKHLPFFEEIASRDEATPEWRAATAGLVALRLVDAWIDDGPHAIASDDWGVRSVRASIDEVDSNEKLRIILNAVVDVLECSTAIDLDVLAPRLMAYGQLLEYDSKWSLANDVYASIIAHTHPVQEAEVATQAHLRRGFCLRQLGDISASLAAYQTAGNLSQSVGDLVGVLRARIGEAKGAMARGNLPQAREILDETIERASRNGLSAVHAMALHDRSSVSAMGGDYEVAIKLAYEALDLSESARERDRILGDIATAFMNLGVHSAARDAYLILVATAQEQYMRWVATLNLLELTASEGEELLFEQYRRSIELGALPTELKAQYWLQSGTGYELLGKHTEARTFLEKALTFAEENELFQVVFQAEIALGNVGQTATPTVPTLNAVVEERVGAIAERLRQDRQKIGV